MDKVFLLVFVIAYLLGIRANYEVGRALFDSHRWGLVWGATWPVSVPFSGLIIGFVDLESLLQRRRRMRR